jgi:arginine/lysine/ornithine decarboxylase
MSSPSAIHTSAATQNEMKSSPGRWLPGVRELTEMESMAAELTEHLKRVLAEHPEARPYVELRQEWQALYRSLQISQTPDQATQEKERAAYSGMQEAYRALPTAVKARLVL